MKNNTLYKRTLKLGAMVMVVSLLTSCNQQKPQVSDVSPASPRVVSAGAPAYPLKVSATGRYVVDQNNTPFLIVGDTPQGLIYRLSEKQADDYFADRQAHGFNTMGWIDVLCAGRDYPANTLAATPDGIRPFNGFVGGGSDWTHYDLSKPNEPYFVRLDHIVELAAKHNLFVFLDPIETGRMAFYAAQQRGRGCFRLWPIPGESLQEVRQRRLAKRQ